MADIQKPVVVADVVDQVAAPVTETPGAEAVVVPEVATAEEVAPAAEEAKVEEAAAEEPKEEAKPIEEGHLGYKAQGLSFPKNLLGSKEFFFFSIEAVEAKALEAYKKAQKSAEGALDNISWAAHTGQGLLFSGDKKSPNNVINLSHASEPEVDGNKFHFTAKGNKHTFKAANVAERDNWVAQIKAKIAEAKEIAASVTESEAYKNTLETLKPAPKEVAKAAEPAVAEETPEAAATEAAAEETPAEEAKVEEPKRRSASRKRASFFGFGKKDLPKEEAKTEEVAEPVVAEEATEVAATDAVVEETPAEDAAVTTEATTEEPAAEAARPAASKRNSLFGGVFSKKEKKAAEPKAETTEAAAEESEAAAETAPVIPPVEATTPLADEVAAAEPTEVAATEAKTDVKEKRKSSLGFGFSKIRATINRKGSAKAESAKETTAEAQETATETATDAPENAEGTVADIKEEVAKVVEGESETKTEEVAAAPAVTASA